VGASVPTPLTNLHDYASRSGTGTSLASKIPSSALPGWRCHTEKSFQRIKEELTSASCSREPAFLTLLALRSSQ
jgi:hypothetical protein